MHKVAVIDLGTNTFNLLIAEKNELNFTIIHSEKIGVALGMGGINEDLISPDAFQRGIDALVHFKEKCKLFETDKILAIGTSALRGAKNSQDFLEESSKQTGIEIQIISGEREAELIYKGVKWSYDFDETCVIMDIGGGSTEFIFADKNGIVAKESFNIGVSRIYQEIQCHDPYSAENVDTIKQWLEEKTNSFFKDKKCSILIGASGSFETFYEMIHHEEFEEHLNAIEFPIEELKTILTWIIASSQKERDEHPYIIPIRRKMAPIAAIKTQWVMNSLAIQKTFVTPCALKEGVLYEEFIEKG